MMGALLLSLSISLNNSISFLPDLALIHWDMMHFLNTNPLTPSYDDLAPPTLEKEPRTSHQETISRPDKSGINLLDRLQ